MDVVFPMLYFRVLRLPYPAFLWQVSCVCWFGFVLAPLEPLDTCTLGRAMPALED